ncbi:MAG: DNA repair protein RecO [Syntrophorhabdales bacterium]|jgi:DNA repair protein RecO (recombination protein O)
MALHKDQAIILSSRVFGESDKILRFLTLRSGKLTGIAKGGKKSQKRFMNTLELFNHVDIEYFEKSGSQMVRIENADLKSANSGIESSFKRMCIASFFAEFADKLTREKERNEPLFRALEEGLEKVKTVEFTYSLVLYYQFRMLHCLGYLPNFKSCIQCGKGVTEGGMTSFSNERGGIVCPACAPSVPHRTYPEGLFARLAALTDAEGTAQGPSYELHARELMEAFMSYHLNVELKSYRLLRGLTV